MATAAHCPHCNFRVPRDTTACPGCGRALEAHDERRALAFRPPGPAFRSALPHARIARGLLHVTSWLAIAGATVQTGHLASTIDIVAREISAARRADIAELGEQLALWVLIAAGVTGLAVAAWSWVSARNLPSLHIDVPDELRGGLALTWVVLGPSLLVPSSVVDELEQRNTRRLGTRTRLWQRRRVGEVLGRWWLMWLGIPSLAVTAALAMADPAITVDGARARSGLAIGAAVGIVVACRAVHDITGIVTIAQAHRADEVTAAVAREAATQLALVHQPAAPAAPAPPAGFAPTSSEEPFDLRELTEVGFRAGAGVADDLGSRK